MFFDEIYNPVSRERTLTEKEMKQAQRDRWGFENPYAIIDGGGKLEGQPLPGLAHDLGWFSGLGDTWKGIPAAAIETASSGLTAINSVLSTKLFEPTTPEGKKFWQEQTQEKVPQATAAVRAYSKNNYDPDPETMGQASQLIYGFVKMLPKAIGYGATLGPAGGALAFGADVGIQETQKLKDEGVDEKTAINAGVLSFAANAVGLRLPAALGSTRIGSMVYGAVANVGTEGFERKGIQYILENQNYDDIAKQYDMSWTDLAISAGVGAAFGAVTWKSPEQIRREKILARIPTVEKAYREKLKEAGFTDEEIDAQVRLNANSALSLLAKADKLDKTDDQLAQILIDDAKVRPDESLDMPNTQGFEWEMGPRKGLSPNDELPLVSAKKVGFDKLGAIAHVFNVFKDGVKNKDTGFNLIMSNSDAKKSAGKDNSEKRAAFLAVANDIEEIASNAKLIESHADVEHKNPKIRGIHVFMTPVDIDGELWRVQLLVKDSIEEGDPRAVVHSIDGIVVEKVMEKPPVGVTQSDGGSSYASVSPEDINRSNVRSGQFRQGRTVSLSRILGGDNPFLRKDKKGLFDAIDPLEKNPDGVYYDWTKDRPDPSLNRKKKQKKASGATRVLHQIGNDILEQRNGDVKGWYDTNNNAIHLTPNADISTFSHEHSHWYMVKLLQFAGEEGMNPEVVDDALQLLKAMHINSLDDWNSLSFEKQRKYYEQFAAWTEIYLSKGKSPIESLEDVFKRLGEWLLDLYRGTYGAETAEKAVGDRYKAEFKEDLPPLSSEVRACLNRMYGAEKNARSIIPSSQQTRAARVAQAQRTNDQKISAPMRDGRDPDAYRAARAAQMSAIDSLNSGEKVDVSEKVRGQQLNDEAITGGQRRFTRAVHMDGSGETVVTLQNRNRGSQASVMQMNSIASDPDYSRLSFSRTTDSGAPIVSFGELPADEFVGVTDYVSDGGNKVPVTYAVVEADSVQTSNYIDGRQNPSYGQDAGQMQAVAGNGRLTGLQEAFNRGTADQYVRDMEADAELHGIQPEAIRKLKKPVLVRVMQKEQVNSGFVDRSNQSQILDMSGAEQAVRDAEKLAGRKINEYSFTEDGEPTATALKDFLRDVGDPNALGSMLDANGAPTLSARNRIKAAIFYEAYRNPELTALAFEETDKQGIKRILNAMISFAPHVITIRNASKGAIDLGPVITGAVNMIRSGETMNAGVLIADNNPASNPAVRQIMEIMANNRDSAAAIMRIMGEFASRFEKVLGDGSDMFGNPLDLADAMQYLRMAQNDEIATQREAGKTVADLPDVDVEAIRATMKALQEAKKPAADVANAMAETVAEKVETKAADESVSPDVQPIDVTSPERAQAVFTEDADRVRVENLAVENPEQKYVVINDDGREVEMTAAEVLEHQQKIEESAKTDADGMGKATECIIRNGGIE